MADGAVVVVDGVSGVEVQTEKAWAVAEELRLPRLVAVNRLDRERGARARARVAARQPFGRAIVPIQLPIGEERSFTGVVDLVSMKAYTFAGDGRGRRRKAPYPPTMTDAGNAAREALIEMVAEADDSLMERFFEAGTLTPGRAGQGPRRRDAPQGLPAGLHLGAREHRRAAGDRRDARLPAVAGRSAVHGRATAGDRRARTPTKAPYAAFVWKTVADPFAGRITMFRVYQARLKADSTVNNAARHAGAARAPCR